MKTLIIYIFIGLVIDIISIGIMRFLYIKFNFNIYEDVDFIFVVDEEILTVCIILLPLIYPIIILFLIIISFCKLLDLLSSSKIINLVKKIIGIKNEDNDSHLSF